MQVPFWERGLGAGPGRFPENTRALFNTPSSHVRWRRTMTIVDISDTRSDPVERTLIADRQPVVLRPIRDADAPLLAEIYASTRRGELAPLTDWSQDQKEAFLKQQFEAQQRHYRARFANASFDLLLLSGEVVGRLYVDRAADELRIIDIALLPAHRGRGLGGALLRALQAEATQRELPLRIHVERFNPARRLYDRLGFREVDDQGIYVLMEWAAS